MFEINYSHLIQYEILEKLVTLIHHTWNEWDSIHCRRGKTVISPQLYHQAATANKSIIFVSFIINWEIY